jgi:heterodisulfide reductase subunit D
MEFTPSFKEDFYVCAQCAFCNTVCEAAGFEPWESDSPRGRVFLLKSFLEGELDCAPEAVDQLSESAYKCTLCGKCGAVCQTDIDLRSLWLDLRTELVNRGHFPQKLSLMREGIEKTGNVANYPNEERASWTDFAPGAPDDLWQREKADVVYFVGCMSSFSPAISSIPESFAQLMEKAEVNFTIMGDKEMCCTYPLIVGGFRDDKKLMDDLREKNIEAVKNTGAGVMVFNCPSCYLTWKEEYDIDIKMYHSTQYLLMLLNEGKLKLANTDGMKISYHDPCDLGRNSKEYDAPREMLKLLGAEVVEPVDTKEKAFCCGGGGDVEVYNPDLSHKMSTVALNAFDDTGVDVTITACQQCKRTFQGSAKKIDSKMKYMDITEFALERIE